MLLDITLLIHHAFMQQTYKRCRYRWCYNWWPIAMDITLIIHHAVCFGISLDSRSDNRLSPIIDVKVLLPSAPFGTVDPITTFN